MVKLSMDFWNAISVNDQSAAHPGTVSTAPGCVFFRKRGSPCLQLEMDSVEGEYIRGQIVSLEGRVFGCKVSSSVCK